MGKRLPGAISRWPLRPLKGSIRPLSSASVAAGQRRLHRIDLMHNFQWANTISAPVSFI